MIFRNMREFVSDLKDDMVEGFQHSWSENLAALGRSLQDVLSFIFDDVISLVKGLFAFVTLCAASLLFFPARILYGLYIFIMKKRTDHE